MPASPLLLLEKGLTFSTPKHQASESEEGLVLKEKEEEAKGPSLPSTEKKEGEATYLPGPPLFYPGTGVKLDLYLYIICGGEKRGEKVRHQFLERFSNSARTGGCRLDH